MGTGAREFGRGNFSLTYAVNVKKRTYEMRRCRISALYLASNQYLMPTGGRFEEIAKAELGAKINESPLKFSANSYDYVIEICVYEVWGLTKFKGKETS